MSDAPPDATRRVAALHVPSSRVRTDACTQTDTHRDVRNVLVTSNPKTVETRGRMTAGCVLANDSERGRSPTAGRPL